MKLTISKVPRDSGFWITPLIAIDTNLEFVRLWICWLWFGITIYDFNKAEKSHKLKEAIKQKTA